MARRELEEHSFALRVQASEEDVSRSRRRVVEIVRARGYPLDEESMSWLALLSGEVIARAVLHTGAPCLVAIRWTGERVRVEVSDSDPLPDGPAPGGPDDAAGRGLMLLNGLATEWGRRPDRMGKVTWFEIGPRTVGRGNGQVPSELVL